jgi:hypothetical protein
MGRTGINQACLDVLAFRLCHMNASHKGSDFHKIGSRPGYNRNFHFISAIFFGQKYIFLLILFVTLRKNQERW